MVEALITQIAAAIGKNFSYEEKGIKAGQKLLNYVGLIKHLKHLKYLKYFPATGWIGNIAEDISSVAGTVGETAEEGTEAAQEALDDTKKLLATIDLTKQKELVVDALRELDRPIIVIIDDLDRLLADEIRSMIQTIKAVADFPRTTYLLTYERAVVARALGFGDENTGLSYLEKIVQIAYPIPPLFQRQLGKFADDKIKKLFDALGITLQKYEVALYDKAIYLLAHLFRQPRDVVRTTNRLLLSLPATHGEVNSVDVIIFEALSQRFPKLREDIHRYPVSFIGHSFRGDLVDEEEEMDWAYRAEEKKKESDPAWSKYLPDDEKEKWIVKKIFQFLFPSNADRDTHGAHEGQLRIADPDRLARYFSMTSIEEVPEVKEIHDMLTNSEKFASALATNDDDELLSLLEWTYNYLSACNTTDVNGSITQLIAVSNQLMAQGRMSDHIARMLAKVMKRVLRKTEGSRNESYIAIAEHAPLSIAEDVVIRATADQGKWVVRPSELKPAAEQLITDGSVVDQSLKAWSARVREAISQGTLHKEVHMHAVLYRLAQFNDAYAEVFQAVWNICGTEKGLEKFLSTYVKDSPFNSLDRFALVDDPERLAQAIDKSSYRENYSWLSEVLRMPDNIKAIKKQAEDLMHKKSSSSSPSK